MNAQLCIVSHDASERFYFRPISTPENEEQKWTEGLQRLALAMHDHALEKQVRRSTARQLLFSVTHLLRPTDGI
jgi:hypothetical protein